MIKRRFIVVAFTGCVVFALVLSRLYASSEDQNKVIESVDRLYEIILKGPKEKIIPTREKIRKMMESYFLSSNQARTMEDNTRKYYQIYTSRKESVQLGF